MAVDPGYAAARKRYAGLGVDTEAALRRLGEVPLSLHCWQGDDVRGFEGADAGLSGGIAVTGAYPGRARTLAELRADLEQVYALIPGRHRLALHASYGDFDGQPVDRDQVAPEHFESWMAWSAEHGIPLDFNSTFFAHPLSAAGFTLSSKEERVRRFWVRHARGCRAIAAVMGERQGSACLHNIWIPDGAKDQTVDRAGYRRLLAESLDEIFEEQLDPACIQDSLEGKLFGIGSEAFVVGSHEFYLAYALQHGKLVTLDTGHFHPTESVADKVSALFLFFPQIPFHLSRGVRWDSDHVAILSDELRELCAELVRGGRLGDACLGLDFFDGSMNRIGAWTIGARAVLKAVLLALLEPHADLKGYEEKGDYFARLALLEALKSLPSGAVWEEHCRRAGVPADPELIGAVHGYEERVTRRRG